jgi:hypothetical protein
LGGSERISHGHRAEKPVVVPAKPGFPRILVEIIRSMPNGSGFASDNRASMLLANIKSSDIAWPVSVIPLRLDDDKSTDPLKDRSDLFGWNSKCDICGESRKTDG